MTTTSGPRADADAAARMRATLARFASGVTVVSTVCDGVVHGMTANAFTSVSLRPQLVLVCVTRGSHMHDLVQRSGSFAVTVLAEHQVGVCRRFAGDRPAGDAQFDGLPWRPAPRSGCPILLDGLAYVDCELAASYPGGDHAILLGGVAGHGPLGGTAPVVFFDSRYRRLDPTDGHRRAGRDGAPGRGGASAHGRIAAHDAEGVR